MTIKDFLSNLFFPRFCLNCQREGTYLCQDCFSLIDVVSSQFCPFCRPLKRVWDAKTCPTCRKDRKLTGLFAAAPYQNFIIKRLISQFKYEPFLKELAKPLASLIIQHFELLEYPVPFFKGKSDFILIPVPLHKKRLKWRGFNQAEEIAGHLSLFYEIPLVSDALLKAKETLTRMELSDKEKEQNIKGFFLCRNPAAVRSKKILLIDDVFTNGAILEECAFVLKEAGAKDVWGVVVARE